MMRRRWSPLVRIVSANSRCRSSRGVSISRVDIPMMAFIGVRISWLMFATNSDLAWVAASAAALARASSVSAVFRSMNCPIWRPTASNIWRRWSSGFRISGLKNSITPRKPLEPTMGNPNAPWSPSMAASGARGKFWSRATSGIQAALPWCQIRPGRPTPAGNVIWRLRSASSRLLGAAAVQISSHRSTFCPRSRLQRMATAQSRLSPTASRISGIAWERLPDWARMRVVSYWVARRRSPARRVRSAAPSDRDVTQIRIVKSRMLRTTTIASPSSVVKSPMCSPASLSQPRRTGMSSAAGRSRRASAPPGSSLVMTVASPRSGRAHRAPIDSSRNATAVGNAIGMYRATP